MKNSNRNALTRRSFLQGAAALGALAQGHAFAAPGLFAAPRILGGDPVSGSLVVVYLRGGADFLNMIVPHRDKRYLAVRPTIGLTSEDGLIELDRAWSLHPAMAPLKPLWDRGHLAPIVSAGSPHATRSHFDAQDFMEFAAPGDRTQRNGWVNRYLTATTPEETEPDHYRAVAMQRLLPRSLRGDFPVLAMSPDFGGREDTDALDAFAKFYGTDETPADPQDMDDQMKPRAEDGEEVFSSGAVTIETMRRFQKILAASGEEQRGYPKTGFGRGLERIGQLFDSDAGLEVAGLDYNGWDHHTGQGGTDGNQAKMLGDLCKSLAAFCGHLGDRLDTTTIVVMTEFGRTVRENGNNGTDHGHGGGMLLIGGGVRGGEVHGEWQGLEDDDLYQGRDLRVTTDFRDVMGEVLRERLGFKLPKDFFGKHRAKKLKLYDL